ncbi:MAG TPA: hypothetical protein VN154_07685 [Rhizomicrobium sp.]|nr:hypothetical protein [Rhizomicrobium sp.]
MGARDIYVVGAGFVSGICAVASIAAHLYLLGLVLFLLNRVSIVVPSKENVALARHALGAMALAGIPFGFVLADARNALAGSFLVIGLLAQNAGARAGKGDGAVALFGWVSVIALALACITPDWFGILAYGLGVFGFAAGGYALAISFEDISL